MTTSQSHNNYDSTIDKLVYKIPVWDYQQWIDYIESENTYETVKEKGLKKTELYPVFMNEIFQRLLRNDNVELTFDTDESYNKKLENFNLELEKWEDGFNKSGLSEDEFTNIYEYKPTKPKRVEPKNEIGWAIDFHNEISISDEFIDLGIEISGEMNHLKKWILSGVGAMKFSEICADKLPNPPKPLVEPEKLREMVRDLQKQLEQAKKEGDEEACKKLKNKIDNKVKQGKQEIINYQNYQEQLNNSNLGEIIKQASEAAMEEVKTMKTTLDMQEGWGWGNEEGSDGVSESVADKLKNAQRLLSVKKFKKIIEQAGRLKLLAEAKRKSKTTNKSVIVGVTTGDDLTNLLPSEYGKFAHQKTRKIFFKDLAEKNTLEFKKEGSDKNQKGPIVVLIDNSGSMAGAKEIWSKAVAIAFLFMAKKDKRDFYAMAFDSDVRGIFEFPKGKFDNETLTKFITFFSNGGTSWERPLNKAVEVISKNLNYKKADIIMITDDCCGVSDAWLEAFNKSKAELSFTAYGVLIGSNRKQALEPFMDSVIGIKNVNNQADSDLILDIF